MFRIYRDTRFGKDKTPYKTAASAQFRHTQGKDVHAPGFYVHLEPDEVFSGSGIWHPEAPTLAQIRDSISSHPAKWKAVLNEKTFKKKFKLDGDSLVRPPKGYDPEHPFIVDLKRKDFMVGSQFSEKEACSPHFMENLVESFREANPLMEFLMSALNLPW